MSNDVLYSAGSDPRSADVYSLIPDPTHGGDPKRTADSRPRDSSSDGKISFWRKVSFGELASVLQFRIGTTIVGM